MAVSETRTSDGRGRHTTTHRELHITSSGVVVIDTPGLRSVGLTGETDLDSIFTDILQLSTQCKFSDCEHDSEPSCAVAFALENGDLNEERWLSYNKLQRELAFEKRKIDKVLFSEEKKKWAKRKRKGA